MTSQQPIILRDGITLEGPLLEHLWGALQVHQHATVVPRYETLGSHHDILVTAGDHSIMYETTGQSQMSVEKVDRLSNDALQLSDRLQRAGEPPLKEVFLVSTTLRSSWPDAARRSFETHRRHLERTVQIKLVSLEAYDVLLPLVESGVLGIRLIDNRVVFAGPEDHAIRYQASSKQFTFGLPTLDQARFRELPHSFLPSHYWEQRYQALFRERMEKELEGAPAWIRWSYPYQFGLKWERSESLRQLWEKWYAALSRSYIMHSESNVFVAESRARSGNRSYGVHIFDISEHMERDKVSELKGLAHRAFWQLTDAQEYLKTERAGVFVYSASDTWSPLAWAEAAETYGKEFYPGKPRRGTDVLLHLLNQCGLGLTFSRDNLVTLAGPPTPAIRLSPQGLQKPI